MDNLVRLVKCLRLCEVKFVQDYYKMKYAQRRLRLRLFQEILKSNITSNKDALRLLYDNRSSGKSALCHLKKKVTNDILNIILIVDSDHSEECESIEIQCEKNLLTSEILLDRGLNQMGLDMLKRTIKMADKYDLPQINLSSYFHLIETGDSRHWKDLKFHVDENIKNYESLIQAKATYFSTCESVEHKSRSLSERTQFWESLVQIRNLTRKGKLIEARNSASHLLSKEFEILMAEKRPLLDLLLAEIHLRLYQYKHAEFHARQAFYQDSNEQVVPEAMLLLINAEVRMGKFHEAESLSVQSGDMYAEVGCQLTALKSALNFYKGEFRKVVGYRMTGLCKSRHQERWGIAIRMIELMALIELEEFELYQHRLEALRKKVSNSDVLSGSRIRLIYRIFRSLPALSFDFSRLLRKEHKCFQSFTLGSTDYSWNPCGIELIDVPKWIHSHVNSFNKNTVYGG